VAGGDTTALLGALCAGEVSALDTAASHLDALHEVHARTNAVAWFDDERALADAHALDVAFAGDGPVGPLHGLPVTVKDWIDVEGFPCAGGSAEHRERRPARDATVVARLRRAGAVVMAKTVPWGGDDDADRVRHPVDPARSAGGSSTGEAVVVAAGASPLGIGSDSGGSVRLPAAWCGVYGLKPTAGRVPTTGHFPRVGALSDGRTQIGPLSRDLDMLELVLSVIAGPDGHDAGVAPVPLQRGVDAHLAGARVAVLHGEDPWMPSDDVAAAVERAADALTAAGLVRTTWDGPWLVEALDITRRYWGRTGLTGADAELQLWDWDRFRRRCLEAMSHVDLLLTPVTAGVAPLHVPRSPDSDGLPTGATFVYTLPASLTGAPALSVPMGADADGLPLAVQLIGRPWDDQRILGAARLLGAAD
jgi:amidase